jgi:hypothetical protein
MSGTKVQKTVLLPLDHLSKIDAFATKQGVRFPTAFQIVIEKGLKEIERMTGPIEG